MSNDRHTNRGGHNKIDLTGKIFGKLTVLKDSGRRKSRRPIWLCQCSCGQQTDVLGKYLVNGDTKSCGCYSKGNAYNRTGFKELSGSYWYIVTSQAKRRGIPCTISAEQAYHQMEKQQWRCAMTGEPLAFAVNLRDSKGQTASLDRIDNLKGYTINNIQWVQKEINIMRNRLDLVKFKSWCQKVIDFSKNTL
jgi:hypothetical protein